MSNTLGKMLRGLSLFCVACVKRSGAWPLFPLEAAEFFPLSRYTLRPSDWCFWVSER